MKGKRTKATRSANNLSLLLSKQERDASKVPKENAENYPANSLLVVADSVLKNSSTSALNRSKSGKKEKYDDGPKSGSISEESYNLLLQNIFPTPKRKENQTQEIPRNRIVVITNENVMWGLQKSILDTTFEKLSLIPNADLSKENLLMSIADEL